MAVAPETVLLALASVILLGFLGQLLFRFTRITDILLLVAFGVALGRGLRFVDTQTFTVLAPIVGTFALLVILFDGGLDLRLRTLMRGLGRALALAILGFGLTVAGVAAVAHYVVGLDWLRAALLGCILGGSSSIAVMPVVRRLEVSERTRAVLSVESALTDVFCVVGALTVASVLALRAEPDVANVGRTIANGFLVGTFVGLLAGAGWLKFLDAKLGQGVSYMLTLALVLSIHVGVTALNANGPVAVLVFGVVLGNASGLRRILRLASEGFTKDLRAFQGEVAFVTRAFFFVYLGIILPVQDFDLQLLATGLVLLAALAVARAGAVFVAAAGSAELAPDRAVWWAMMPRGLAAAVLASVPALTFGITGTEAFVAYAAAVIILTNIVASFAGLVSVARERLALDADEPAGKPKKATLVGRRPPAERRD